MKRSASNLTFREIDSSRVTPKKTPYTAYTILVSLPKSAESPWPAQVFPEQIPEPEPEPDTGGGCTPFTYVLDTFQGTGTLATHVGEVGATWTAEKISDIYPVPNLSKMQVDSAGAHLEGDYRVAMARLSGKPDANWDVFYELAFTFPTVGADAFAQFSLTENYLTGESTNWLSDFTKVAAFIYDPTQELMILVERFNGTTLWTSNNIATGLGPGSYVLRLELTADRTRAQMFLDGIKLYDSGTVAAVPLPANLGMRFDADVETPTSSYLTRIEVGHFCPPSDVFSLQRFDSLPLVDSVSLTSTDRRYLPPSLGSPGAMIEGSTSALLGDSLMNGPMFWAYRNDYARSMYLAEPGFTAEMFLYREGGAAFDANTSWEWSGEIYFGRAGAWDEEQYLQFWWHGGHSWGGATNIGMWMIGDVLGSAATETPLTMPDSLWTHVAWEVEGALMRCYVAGQLVLTGAITGGPVTTFHQFRFVSLDNYYSDSHVRAADEFRVTGRPLYKGVNFTPPTRAFPDPNPL